VKTYSVVFAPEAEDDLVELFEYIVAQGSPAAAARYIDDIVAYCEGLGRFSHRGTKRDDIRPGLRITNYRRRVVIAFSIDESAETVAILGVYYAGRDYEAALGADEEDD
jgi:plasmid stabilization system protein ParE